MPERKRLDGWDEISDHLRVNRKTARRWEKQGMPVWGGGRRSAYTDQLDRWLANGRRRLEPVTADLFENRLTTYYDRDLSLWSYDFSRPLFPQGLEENDWRLQISPLGSHEGKCVLAACRFRPEAQDGASADELFCFDNDGRLLWRMPARLELLDRDRTQFPNAWRFKHMVIDVPDPAQAVWLALANSAGWAGGVVKVDANGTARVQFANAGHVERLAVIADGERRIVFCGENNDFDQAFVASFGVNDPPAASPPGRRERYRYGNAPQGNPQKYVLFPRTELIKAQDKPYGHAIDLHRYPDDIIVDVDTTGEAGYFRYHFTTDLEPAYVFPSGSHEFRHQTLEREGRIHHPWQLCPEVRNPLDLAIWEPGSGWRTEQIRWRDTYPTGY